jgi:hypothetical protein
VRAVAVLGDVGGYFEFERLSNPTLFFTPFSGAILWIDKEKIMIESLFGSLVRLLEAERV